jgi:hypothetical protein
VSVRRFAGAAFALALLLPSLASAQGGPKIEFDIDGYYRMRGHAFFNLYDKDFPKDGARDVTVYYVADPDEDIPAGFVEQWNETHSNYTTSELVHGYCRSFPNVPQCRRAIHDPNVTTWFVSRGRFEPILRVGETIKVQATLDVLDNVVWGDNQSLASTPLFADDPSATQYNGDVTDTIHVRRLWAEWKTAIGLIRIGRQPSNWGMGLLAKDGDGFDNDFGDNYGGAVFDRILFATRPITLVKGIAAIASGKAMPNPADDPGLVFAFAYDRLVTSSSITFRKQLTDDDNLPDEADGNYRRSAIWLSDQGDDVHEVVFALALRKEDWKIKDKLMDLTVGGYLIHRWQRTTQSAAWIPDLYIKWKLMGVFVEGELYYIGGGTNAIAPEFDKRTQAKIMGTAWRAGYENPLVKAMVEVGHAQGDDSILNDEFTGRALHSDHNVGLILYEQVLAQRTIEKFVGDPDYQGLWSNGGVYNSTYVNPRFTYKPDDVWEFRLGFLMAFADEIDGNIMPFLDDLETGESESAGNISQTKLLGTEIDAGIHMKWLDDHIMVSVEGGYMRAGRRLGRTSQYQDPSEAFAPLAYNAAQYQQISNRLNNVFTLQGRFAFIF